MQELELAQATEAHLCKPQRSERWAMYRLIVPVVDFANSTLGLNVHFEFCQPSSHGTYQSVDIALLDGHLPRVLVEAKRVDRRLAAEQISKYLSPGERGLVSNGVHWILCDAGESKAVTLRSPSDGRVDIDALREIVSFIRGEKRNATGWTSDSSYIDPVVKPLALRSRELGRRTSNLVTAVTDTEALGKAVSEQASASMLDAVFLTALASRFDESGGLPAHLRCEVRSSRVVFFDTASATGRLVRIELGKRQPDVLVRTALVGANSELSQIAPAVPHDKGPHMRRYRLASQAQAIEFGRALARALSGRLRAVDGEARHVGPPP